MAEAVMVRKKKPKARERDKRKPAPSVSEALSPSQEEDEKIASIVDDPRINEGAIPQVPTLLGELDDVEKENFAELKTGESDEFISASEMPPDLSDNRIVYPLAESGESPLVPSVRPLYPKLTEESSESPAMEEMDYRNYVLSRSRPSDSDDSVSREKENAARVAKPPPVGVEENVFEKAFSDAVEAQMRATVTMSLGDANRSSSREIGEIDLTRLTALKDSLPDPTLEVAFLSPSAPPIVADPTAPVMASQVTPGTLVLPEGSVEKIPRQQFNEMISVDSLESSTEEVDSESEEVIPESRGETEDPLPLNQLKALWQNPLAQKHQRILEGFFAEVPPCLISQHPLYELLVEYQRSRAKLMALEEHLQQLKRDVDSLLPGLWTSSAQTTVVEGVCRDNNKVTQQLTYEQAALNEDQVPKICQSLSTMRLFAQEQLSHVAFVCAQNRLKIAVYLYKLYTEICPALQNIPMGATVTMGDGSERDASTQQQVKMLKQCINVLFSFQRKLLSDTIFQNDTREWLTRLVATMLRLATYSDHAYLLHHLLRCPPGVGKWASSFLQIPRQKISPKDSSGFQEKKYRVMAILRILLQTIDNREDFLTEMQEVLQCEEGRAASSSPKDTTPWVFLDPVGDEDVDDPASSWHFLKETDLIALLDQIPLDVLYDDSDLFSPAVNASDEFPPRTGRLQQSLSAPAAVVSSAAASRKSIDLIFDETLTSFSFATHLVDLLCTGLENYRSARYRLFAQRLAVLVCKTIDWAGHRASAWACPRLNKIVEISGKDPKLRKEAERALHKVRVEFDAFFHRSVTLLVNAQKLGAWMFIADLAFSSVSPAMARKLMRMLSVVDDHILDEKNCSEDSDTKKLECKLVDLPMADVTHLLTTMAKLACARPIEELQIIKDIVAEIFRASFVSPSTREFCSKLGQQLLSLICNTHPHILSFILQHKIGALVIESEGSNHLDEVALPLFKSLPVSIWKPTEKDLQVLRQWLLDSKNISSIENQVARNILCRIDWSRKDFDGSVTAHYLLVKTVATLLVEGYEKHCGSLSSDGRYWISSATANVLSMGYKQVTNFTNAVLNVPPELNPEKEMTLWAWDLLMRLDLHTNTVLAIYPPLPVPKDYCQNNLSLDNSNWITKHVISPSKLDEDLDLYPVQQAIKNNHSALASFVAILLTQIGQNPEHFVSEGGVQMFLSIVNYGQYEAAVNILNHILPLFFVQSSTCLEYLAENSEFSLGICQIINSELVKNANCIQSKVVALIISQLKEASKISSTAQLTPVDTSDAYFSLPSSFGKPRPTLVYEFWIRSLTASPDWYTLPGSLFVIEKLILYAYQASSECAEYFQLVNKVFQERFTSTLGNDRVEQKGLLYSVVAWMSSSSEMLPTLLDTAVHQFPAVALHILTVETNYEEEIGLWAGLQRELLLNPKMAPAAAFKTTLQSLSLPDLPLNRLSIFRWSLQILETLVSHPLMPLLWQRFFAVFLRKPLTQDGFPYRGSIGDILLNNGPENDKLTKSLKKQAKKCCDYYYELLRQFRAVNSPSKTRVTDLKICHHTELINRLINFFKSCEVWLDEPRLHDSQVYLPTLPDVYDSPRLLKLFNANDKEIWLELVDCNCISFSLDETRRIWYNEFLAFKISSIYSQGSDSSEMAASEVSVSGLSVWQPNTNMSKNWTRTSRPPPELIIVEPPFPPLAPKATVDKQIILATLRSDFSSLVGHCRAFSGQISRAHDLDEEYAELLSRQFINEPTPVKVHLSCKSLFNPTHRCKGINTKTVIIEEKKQNVNISRQISDNRLEISELIPIFPNAPLSKSAFTAPPNYLIISTARVEYAIEAVIQEHRMKNNDKSQAVGAALFYYMMKLVSPDSTEKYIPMRQFFSTSLEQLGQIFILPITKECQSLVTSILNLPHMAGILSPLLPHPASSAPDTFLQMYTHVVSEMKNHPSDLIFMLMTKFDVGLWLQNSRPKLSERAALLGTVGIALSQFGLDPAPESQLTFDILKSHLRRLVRYQFPDLYGDFLRLLLRESERSLFSPCLWPILLEPLQVDIEKGDEDFKISELQTKCLAEAKPLPSTLELSETDGVAEVKIVTFKGIPRSFRKEYMDPITPILVRESLECLTANFIRLRTTDPDLTTFGLYPRWRPYVSSLSILYRFLGLNLMESQLRKEMSRNLYFESLVEFWSLLNETFRPWLHPLEGRERIMTPWIEGDTNFALEMLQAFKDVVAELHVLHKSKLIENKSWSECLQSGYSTSPVKDISPLNFVWNQYCTVLSLPGTPQHILETFHTNLKKDFEWNDYILDMHSIELMLQLRETRHPCCFNFLTEIFAEFPWVIYLTKVINEERQDQVVRIHTCFLDLLMTLSTTKPFLDSETPKLESLFLNALEFNWQFVDRRNFDAILQRYVEQCDPSTICAKGRLNPAVLPLRLLKVVSALEVHTILLYPTLHPETQEKRVSMVRGIINLSLQVLSSSKCQLKLNKLKEDDSPLNTPSENIIAVISNLMTDIESMTPFSSNLEYHHQELVRLLSEVFSLINQCPAEYLPPIAEAIRQFLAASSGSVLIVPGIAAASQSLVSLKHMSQIIESCIETYFLNQEFKESDLEGWKPIVNHIKIPEMNEPLFVKESLNCEGFLTLYAYLLQKVSLCGDLCNERALLNETVQWMIGIKTLNQENESKILLWFGKIFELLFRQIGYNFPKDEFCTFIIKLSSLFAFFAEDKASSGFLGMIGLGKRSSLSTRFRLVCRILEVFILAQIREDGSPRTNPDEPLPSYLVPKELAQPSEATSSVISNDENVLEKPNPSPAVITTIGSKHFIALNSLKNNRHYVDLKPELEASLSFITDRKNVFFHVYKLFLRLISSLFADKQFLDVLQLSSDTSRCLP